MVQTTVDRTRGGRVAINTPPTQAGAAVLRRLGLPVLSVRPTSLLVAVQVHGEAIAAALAAPHLAQVTPLACDVTSHAVGNGAGVAYLARLVGWFCNNVNL